MKLTAKHLRHIIREELNLFESAGNNPWQAIIKQVNGFPVSDGIQESDIAKFVAGLPGPMPRSKDYPDGFHIGNLFTQVALRLAQNGWRDDDVLSGIMGSELLLGPLFAAMATDWGDTSNAGREWAAEAFPAGGSVKEGFPEWWKNKHGIDMGGAQPEEETLV
jgi:hypothetical protein